jgi:dsDNA-specific endonuclease/ATPase MutS2
MYRLVDTDSSTAEFKKALETLTKENSVVVSDKILLDTTPNKSIKKEKPKENFLKEVDLHIQSLVESTTGLTPKEMLDIQMRQFRVEFENALAERYKRVVFIHGLGNGTLKNEIRRTLDREYKKYEYHDASFKEYGFGATMVILSKK